MIKLGVEKKLIYPTLVDAVRSRKIPQIEVSQPSNSGGLDNPGFIITEGEAEYMAKSGGRAQIARER